MTESSSERISNDHLRTTKFNYTDVWLPKDVVEALIRGEITPTGFAVLLVVRSLTVKKRWCWPNNRYIALATGRNSINKVSQAIINLTGLGFLKSRLSRSRPDRRYLQLAWSWTLRKRVSPLTQKGQPPLTQKGQHIESTVDKKDSHPLTRDGRHTPELISLCGRFHAKLAEERKIIKSTSPLTKWPTLAFKFIKKLPGGEERFIRVVDGYIGRFGEAYMPEAFSMRSLVDNAGDKFFRIERKLNRPDWSKNGDPNKLSDDEVI